MQIDVRDSVRRAGRWANVRTEGLVINTGFVSFRLTPLDCERTAARQLVVRLRDKRVFTASDCGDSCVQNSIDSLQGVREILVEAQAQLADLHDGQLFWLTDYARQTIRAFLTWEEQVRSAGGVDRPVGEHYRDPKRTREYIEQLDILRAHVRRAMTGIAGIANMELPPQGRAELELVMERRHLLLDD